MPERGGDTVFANTAAAYEGLSAPFREFLDGLVAIHNGEEAFGEQIRANGYGEWDGDRFSELRPVEHPVVRTDPEIPSVSQYAGQQLLTGQQAEVYANDFIAVHLRGIGGGKTYSQLSAAALSLPKGSAAYTAAEAKAQTVFQGTTLRGLLLEAYGFSLIAAIAFWCAIAAFCLAGVMAVLVGLGFAHARRTSENEELLPGHTAPGALVTA